MTPTIRTLLTSFLIAAVAPVGLAVLDLETPAFAKNGGGNGGGHGGGNGHGGDHGNSGGSHGNSGNHGTNKTADATDDSDTTVDADEPTDEDDGLSPSELGKLNGVLHASPNAIAHASVNSPIGTARAFGEALGGFLGQTPPTEDTTTEDTTDEGTVSIDDLGAMMAKMTNKPVTAAQVEAVAAKVGIETEEEDTTGDEAAGDETTQDTTTDETADDQTGDEAPKLDAATAQAIADSANAIHDGTVEGDDTADDGDTADDQDGDTADAGDDAGEAGETGDTDETVSD